MQIEATKYMATETAHRLLEYKGKCGHLHGHRYEWEVTVARYNDRPGTNQVGFVVDFSELKAYMEAIIHSELDHALVLNAKDPIISAMADTSHMASLLDRLLRNPADVSQPLRIVQVPFNPSVENLAQWVGQELDAAFKANGEPFRLMNIRVHETRDSFAEWRTSPTP